LQGENSTEKEDKHRHGTIHAKYKWFAKNKSIFCKKIVNKTVDDDEPCS
jgi:hypothetical protein